MLGHALLDPSAYEHSRQEHRVRIRKQGAHGHGAGVRIDRDVGRLQRSRLAVFGAVFEQQLHLDLIGAVELQLSAGHVAPQLQSFSAGLREVDVDGIDLLDGCHQRRLAHLHVSTLGDLRYASATADGRDHVGIAEIDLRRVDRGPARSDIGFRLSCRRHRVVVVLLAHRIAFNKRLEALDLSIQRNNVGLRFLQRSLGAVERGHVGRGIDLVEALAGLDVGAFLVVALEHDAVDARAHLRDQVCVRSPGKLDRHRHGRSVHGDDADLRRLSCGRRLRFAAGGENDYRRCRGQHHAVRQYDFWIHERIPRQCRESMSDRRAHPARDRVRHRLLAAVCCAPRVAARFQERLRGVAAVTVGVSTREKRERPPCVLDGPSAVGVGWYPAN